MIDVDALIRATTTAMTRPIRAIATREDGRHRDSRDPRDVFTQGLTFPRGLEREHVHVRRRSTTTCAGPKCARSPPSARFASCRSTISVTNEAGAATCGMATWSACDRLA